MYRHFNPVIGTFEGERTFFLKRVHFGVHFSKKGKIQILLRQTGCRKLYRSLYGDISKIVLAAEDDFNSNDFVKEGDWDEKSFTVSPKEYLKNFISILKKINTPKNDD